MKVGVLGASGFTGAELLRLCAGHPDLEVVVAGAETHAGQKVGALYPSLRGAYPSLGFTKASPHDLEGLDGVFLALPHGASQEVAPALARSGSVVVDLSADFRLRDPALYETWYGREHLAPELLGSFAYGLPELYRPALEVARLVAAPGCYPTAAALAIAPLVRAGLVKPDGVVVDAASGVSGAGRGLDPGTQFAAADEDFRAYGLPHHRHTPEIEQASGAEVLFTPHLAPMVRGILATCYLRPLRRGLRTDEVLETLRHAYAGEPFVLVSDELPSTKATLGSNMAHLSARVDDRTGWVVVLCALDNLVKGASGQALQCANLLFGLPEERGLPKVGLYP